ncbi:MAG: hypothetical protein DRN81_03630 [Thermoproteota archaeon]|nr:MAG: hypothetical protein DRN81_03630 [Candidatus Korarchaeota archaeon]
MVLIKFYVPSKLKEFLKGFAKENGMEMSELIRHALIYFHMAYLLGELKTPYDKLKKRFLETFDNAYKSRK